MNYMYLKKKFEEINKEHLYLSLRCFSKIIGVNATSLGDALSGKRDIKTLTLRNYEKIANALFTDFEQFVLKNAERKHVSLPLKEWRHEERAESVFIWYNILVARKVVFELENNPKNVEIRRSGCRDLGSFPSYASIKIKQPEDYIYIYIFDGDLYKNLQGKTDKARAVLEYYQNMLKKE